MSNENKLEQFLELVNPLLEEGIVNLTHGKLDGEDFLIVESWDDVAYITGFLNGFTGLKNHFGGWNGETLQEQRSKLEMDLAVTESNQHGTIRRIKNEIEAINSNIAYKLHLEQAGIEEPKSIDDFVEHGFSDEYTQCCNCTNILRTSPDSYSWTAPLFVEGEGYVCSECIESGDFDDYVLDSFKNEEKSIPDDFDLDRLGLVKVNDDSFQNGWYGGQCDTPAPIIEALNDQDIDVWFKVFPRQFDLDFDVYVRVEDVDRAKQILSGVDVTADEDPATLLERGLKAVSEHMASVQEGEGIKYGTINSDGTASVRLVSKEEFIKGIK